MTLILKNPDSERPSVAYMYYACIMHVLYFMPSKPEALFRQIYRNLKEDIENRTFVRGTMLPSENSLCIRFETSRQTIRSALKLLDRDDLASNLPGKGWIVGPYTAKRKESKNIKPVCFLGRTNNACNMIFAGVQQAFADTGLSCEFVPLPTHYLDLWQDHIESYVFNPKKYSAVFIFEDKDIPQTFYELCQHNKLPLIQLGHYQHCPYDTICADFHQGCWDIVEKLYQRGHRSIGFYCNAALKDHAPFKRRYFGYRAAMLEFGLHEKKLFIDYEYMSHPQADQVFMDWMNEKENTTALVDGGGGLLPAIHLTLLRNGIRVPEDVTFAFIGDSTESINRSAIDKIDPLMLIEPWLEIGETVAQRIRSRLSDENAPPSQTLVPMKLCTHDIAVQIED